MRERVILSDSTLPETNSEFTPWKWLVGILFRFLLGQTAYFQVRTGRFVSGSGLLLVSLEPPCCWLFRCNLHGLFDPNIFIILFYSSWAFHTGNFSRLGHLKITSFAKGTLFEANLHLHLARLTWNLRIHPWEKEKQSSKPSFSGSMLNFWGVYSLLFQPFIFPGFFFSAFVKVSSFRCTVCGISCWGRWHFFLGPAQKESGNLAANPNSLLEGLETGVWKVLKSNHRCGG